MDRNNVKAEESQPPSGVKEDSEKKPDGRSCSNPTFLKVLGETHWQKRLSLLFVPPNEKDFETDKGKGHSSLLNLSKGTRTLSPNDTPITPLTQQPAKQNQTPNQKDSSKLSNQTVVVDSLDKENRERKSSSSSSSSEDEDEGKEKDYSSYDDTICSNRSAYFKMYYQRGLGGFPKGDDTRSKNSQISHYNSLTSLFREKMDKLSIFGRIKFTEDERILDIYDINSADIVVKAKLGINLPVYALPRDCTQYLQYLRELDTKNAELKAENETVQYSEANSTEAKHAESNQDMVCLDWAYQARLQLFRVPAENGISCFDVHWKAVRNGLLLTDCILMGDWEKGIWWGGGEISGGVFALDVSPAVPPKLFETGIFGVHPWGGLLRRAWLSSKSALLIAPENQRTLVSINYEDDGYLCLSTRQQDQPHAVLPILNYTLCTGPNITAVIDFLHNINNRKMLMMNESDVDYRLSYGTGKAIVERDVEQKVFDRISNPVWRPWLSPDQLELNQEIVMDYVKKVNTSMGEYRGHILLPSTWQANAGDLEFDAERFPDPGEMAAEIKDAGFKLALTVSCFVAADTETFENGTKSGLWVRQKNSLLPVLAISKETFASAIADFTNVETSKWFIQQLSELPKKYDIDRFHLVPPLSQTLPEFHEFLEDIPNSDATLKLFLDTVSVVSVPISTEAVTDPPAPPTFVTLNNEGIDGWNTLKSLVPRVLSLSLIGMPFIDIGIVGGSFSTLGHVPERELYIRWLQVATFMPAFQMSVLPSVYDESVQNLTNTFMEIRKDRVIPRFELTLQEALAHHRPLVIPLSYMYRNDFNSSKIQNQWMIGDDLLVAPVLDRLRRSRDIYLPLGIWKDYNDNKLRGGNRWLRGYKVPLNQIPHFQRVSVDDISR